MANRKHSTHALDAGEIVKTALRLQERIAARFPDSGLQNVCAGLVQTAQVTGARARRLARPYYLLRLAVVAIVAIGIAAQVYFARVIEWGDVIAHADPVGVTQGLDAIVNLLVLAGGAVWFLMTAETRLKRRRVLRWLHELRSTAHVIDMHQLTKDPSSVLGAAGPTPSSPRRTMNRSELARYLDYCSEMLSLTSKLAALYAQNLPDPVVIDAVNDIESLTGNLGRKIWQKITILESYDAPVPSLEVRPPDRRETPRP
jgi:hypothetical protein